MWLGYIKSLLTRQQQYDDPKFRAFLRRYQWNSLIKGKAKATQELNANQADKWKSLVESQANLSLRR